MTARGSRRPAGLLTLQLAKLRTPDNQVYSSTMSSIDEIFKRPVLPSQKRKLEPIRDPNQVYKSPKINGNDTAHSNAHTTVEDEPDEDNDDLEAGPELPPDFDEDAGGDEEGRFFGGGVSESTAQAINFLDTNDEEDTKEEKIDISWLRRTALNFERKINKNSELRAKFESDPQKFMSSEADLDTEIKTLSSLSEHPELYPEFAKLGCTGSLVSLLAHENTDIAIDAIEIIGELIDDDVDAEEEHWNALVDGLLEADLLDLLYANLTRLNEDQETDRAGVYNVLGVLESLASKATLADNVGQHKNFLPWLLNRAKQKEQRVGQNKQYAAELIAILLQSSVVCRSRFIDLDGVEVALQVLSLYRKRDPERGTDEEEFMENVFDALACALDEPAGKAKFLEAEGTELCLIMLREGKASKPRALRLLDHALSGIDGGNCCEQFVEAAGLKPLFSAFMKKQDAQSTEHMLGMLASLLRSLPADSAPRIRVLAKLVEKDYQKTVHLAELRLEYAQKVHKIDTTIAKEKEIIPKDEQADFQDDWLSRRLEAGLYALQTADTILAWLIAEDDGARVKILELLSATGQSIADVKRSLEEQSAAVEAGVKEMLSALLGAI